MLDHDTETAYNLWARHVDRPAEWWFSGVMTVMRWEHGELMLYRVSPYRACRMGESTQVLSLVQTAVGQMELAW